MALIADYIFDLALAELDTNVTHLYICSAEPTTFTQATSTFALGVKATPTVSAPANGAVNGRRVTVSAITDGSVSATGTATHWALTKTTGSTLMATGALSASQAVTNGNTFTLAAYDVTIADAA
jgi:hypothetical protein